MKLVIFVPLNALFPIDVIFPSRIICILPGMLTNALVAIAPPLITIVFNPVKSAFDTPKKHVPKSCVPVYGASIYWTFVRPFKQTPQSVQVAGIMIFFKFLHPENAPS